MGVMIGITSGYSTWARLRTPITLPGNNVNVGAHSIEYLNGFAFHAGFRSTDGWLLRGDKGGNPASIGFQINSPGSGAYFYSSFFTGSGGNTTNSLDESHALALIGQTVTLDDTFLPPATVFTITADYKDTLAGQLVLGPTPPATPASSGDIDQVGLLTAFDS